MRADDDRRGGEDAVDIVRGNLDAEAVIARCLARIRVKEPQLHAFREVVDADTALAAARGLGRAERSRPTAPLHGVPIAVKEVIDVSGMRCTWGTAIHADRTPERDADVVAQLRAAGAIVVGTTISTEYAIAQSGMTVNPWDPARTPGGSSSGSAAAVAVGMVPIALGTQTIGSIVRPATYCGIYALKPTHGAISTQGVMPLSAALDHLGVFARTQQDLALAWRALGGGRGTLGVTSGDKRAGERTEPAALTVLIVEGYPGECVGPESRAAVERAVESLRAAAIDLRYAQLPEAVERSEESLEVILCHDIALHHGTDRDRHGAQMSARLLDLIDRGRTISEARYASALDHARRVRVAFAAMLRPGSILLAPATDGVAPYRSEDGTGSPRLQGIYSLAGLPTLAVPCGDVGGLPVGVQLVATAGGEDRLLARLPAFG